MARLPVQQQSKTAAAIFAAAEKTMSEPPRPHLGCSQVGKECERDIWYGFRWATLRQIPGRVLRLFDRGRREEDSILWALQRAGVEVTAAETWSRNMEKLRISFGGHLRGTADARAIGIPEAPKTEHIVDIKTAKEKSFKKAKACGDDLKAWSPTYYAQAQLYMLGTGLKRAMYIVVNKNDDDIHTMRVQFDRKEAHRLVDKGHRLSTTPEPPAKISDDPTFYKCKWCDHVGACQYGKVEDLQRNCRTCASVTPRADGTWFCELHQTNLDVEKQRRGCSLHLFIPRLLPWPAEDFDEKARAVTYRRPDGLAVVDGGRDLAVRP